MQLLDQYPLIAAQQIRKEAKANRIAWISWRVVGLMSQIAETSSETDLKAIYRSQQVQELHHMARLLIRDSIIKRLGEVYPNELSGN